MSINEIPTINIQGLFEENEEKNKLLINEIRHACKEYGFFYIYNHHVDPDLISEFRRVAENFFNLPKEKKCLIKRTRENSRGFFDEELTKNVVDWKEGFDYGAQDGSLDKHGMDGFNQWPTEPIEFESIMRKWFTEMEKLSKLLLEMIAKSLDWDKGIFASHFDSNHTSLMRLNHYPICPDPENNMGVHHHTDAGVLTVLLQDDYVNSLYVFYNNQWISIPPKKVWTNDRYKAPLHRVVANSTHKRFSAPFFYNPSYSTDVRALNLSSSEKPLYNTINWGHFRSQRFAGDYANYGEEIQISQFKIG